MSDKELKWNDDLEDWELCSFCFEIAMDAAYSGEFRYDEDEFEFAVDDEFDLVCEKEWNANVTPEDSYD